jgi:hypothetical protein
LGRFAVKNAIEVELVSVVFSLSKVVLTVDRIEHVCESRKSTQSSCEIFFSFSFSGRNLQMTLMFPDAWPDFSFVLEDSLAKSLKEGIGTRLIFVPAIFG